MLQRGTRFLTGLNWWLNLFRVDIRWLTSHHVPPNTAWPSWCESKIRCSLIYHYSANFHVQNSWNFIKNTHKWEFCVKELCTRFHIWFKLVMWINLIDQQKATWFESDFCVNSDCALPTKFHRNVANVSISTIFCHIDKGLKLDFRAGNFAGHISLT